MEQGNTQERQAVYSEYIPADILEAAGIYGEQLAMEQLRFELYELENDVAAGKGELEGMRKKWSGIRQSLRFSLIMFVTFYLLRRLMLKLGQEQAVIYARAGGNAEGEAFVLLLLISVLTDVFQIVFFMAAKFFLVRSVYKLYQFFSNYDSEASRRWCTLVKQKNLCHEIEQFELRFIRLEDRLRRLKQVRTMYRERKQEEWREGDLPERIAMERGLAMKK